MAYFELFIVFYFILYIGFKLLFNSRIKKEKYEKLTEINYFVKKFKLKKNKIVYKTFYRGITVINSFIIAFVATLIMFLDMKWEVNYFLELLIGFIIIFLLMYSLYEIYGRYLKEKENDKNGN